MTTPCMHNSQRGAATLLVTLVLFLALALVVLGLHRALSIEQRGATQRVRATQAFEAAEAGLAWMQSRLNSVHRIGPDCAPSSDANATTFRERYLAIDRATGAVAPSTAQPGCVRGASGWACSCPVSGAAALSAPGGTEFAPAFTLSLQSAARAGAVRIVANGCTSVAGTCAAGGAGSTNASVADGSARTEVTLGLFAGLRGAPTAAVTARAAAETPEQFFAARFGIDAPTWRGQSVVARIACTADCGDALRDAVEAGHALLWIDGDLALTAPLPLGTSAHPVLIAASGAVRLSGGVTVVGVVHGASVALVGATVRGAVLSADGDAGAAAAGAVFDADVVSALTRQTGSFVRVNGSWRDFLP